MEQRFAEFILCMFISAFFGVCFLCGGYVLSRQRLSGVMKLSEYDRFKTWALQAVANGKNAQLAYILSKAYYALSQAEYVKLKAFIDSQDNGGRSGSKTNWYR